MTVNVGSRATMVAVGMEYVRTFYPGWDEPVPAAGQGEVELVERHIAERTRTSTRG
jgi:hypothetical protein